MRPDNATSQVGKSTYRVATLISLDRDKGI